ncbi:MAG: 1,4-alpha-glucan branching protein GlgB [Gemmatimonadota bacterium]
MGAPTVDPGAVAAIVAGRHSTPFEVLGIHPLRTAEEPGRVVRVWLPGTHAVRLLDGERAIEMERVHPEGFFELTLPEERRFLAYGLEATDSEGRSRTLDDPYWFGPVLDEDRLDRLKRGGERRVHEFLGARPMTHEGAAGTLFSVWAPFAQSVCLLGSFNRWEARAHPMRPRGSTGVWELFIPAVGPGALYKYEIRTKHGDFRMEKADPCGFAMELRPATASVVWDLGRYEWSDAEWMRRRARRQAADAPLAIYEVHLGSWRRASLPTDDPGWLGYREIAERLLPYVRELGYTHVELLPVTEYPLDASWGYQTVGYFAPTSRFGSPDDFRFFIDEAHRLGLGVILDWVPAHFPRDGHGLGFFDGTHLYEHEDPRKGVHPDWGTLIYNYGRPEVAAFLISSALFWIEEYHIDGLRVDAVASMLYLDYSRAEGEWLPNVHGGRENLEAIAFLRELNEAVHEEAPGVLTIAEESTAWPNVTGPTAAGGLGFDLKWNMGWMHDTLELFRADPLFRRAMHHRLTFSILYAFSERFLLPLSHDEVVHLKGSLLAKMSGDHERKLSHLRLLFGYMYGHPGKKLLFMGGEFGQAGEWNFEGELQWSLLDRPGHRGLHRLVRELNRLYVAEPSLHELDHAGEGFEWIEAHDADRSVLAFLRWAEGWRDFVLVVCNFTPVAWDRYRVGVPYAGTYEAILNTDDSRYGGSGEYPFLEAEAEEMPSQGRALSLECTLPPLSVLFLKRLGRSRPLTQRRQEDDVPRHARWSGVDGVTTLGGCRL